MIKEVDYKTEGNIIYPDETMLTWGPFYYHSKDKAKDMMGVVLTYIVDWCNEKDPSLNISPQKLIRTRDGSQIVFEIQAWRDDKTLQKCNGIVTVEQIFFED